MAAARAKALEWKGVGYAQRTEIRIELLQHTLRYGRIEGKEVREQDTGQICKPFVGILCCCNGSSWEVLSRKSSLISLVLRKITLFRGQTVGAGDQLRHWETMVI